MSCALTPAPKIPGSTPDATTTQEQPHNNKQNQLDTSQHMPQLLTKSNKQICCLTPTTTFVAASTSRNL
jgi:hypothetical protein